MLAHPQLTMWTISNNLPLTHWAETCLRMHWADLSSDTKCWNRAADAQRAHHTPQAVGPPHTSPNTQQRVLGLLCRHSPQKASPLGGCTLNFINHTCPPTTQCGTIPNNYPCQSIRYSRRLAGRGVPRGKGSPSPADSDDRPSVTRRVAWANRWRSFDPGNEPSDQRLYADN